MNTTTISCPACSQGQIIIQPYLLLEGQAFSCSFCHAKLALHHDSKPLLSQSLEAFDQLKEQLARKTDRAI